MSDAMKTVFDAARNWRDELTEHIIPGLAKSSIGGAEEMEGCESEAEEISAALDQLQPITIYFTGDNESPDRFGLAYDNEDDALESARENELQVWSVPVVPNWDAAENVTPGDDDE